MENFKGLPPEYQPYPDSRREAEGLSVLMVRDGQQKYLAVKGEGSEEFEGNDLGGVRICGLSSLNCQVIREVFPELKPVPCNGNISFGFGDRLGIATPGHLKSLGNRPFFPVLAQQSVRENDRTKRSMQQVLDEATWGVLEAGYRGSFGADADHIKDIHHLKYALRGGFSMFTIDISDHIKDPDRMTPDEARNYYEKIPDVKEIESFFRNKEFKIGRDAYKFTPEATRKAIITFAEGMAFAVECYRTLKNSGKPFDFEVSVDETSLPTSPLEHIFIAGYLRKNAVHFTSLAPRFLGHFEKAIDYKGDLKEFEENFQQHLQISRVFGNHRLSLHSGSDKFSVYPIVSKSETFHVKTAGTSWLQAVKTIALKEPSLYRRIHQCALRNIENDRASYSISLNLAKIPSIETMTDDALADLFSQPDTRQLIHITYGSVLAQFRPDIYRCLFINETEHYRQVSEHLKKHLDLLLNNLD